VRGRRKTGLDESITVVVAKEGDGGGEGKELARAVPVSPCVTGVTH